MRKCADCARLQQRISDLNSELLVLRIAALAANNRPAVGQKAHVRDTIKPGSHVKSTRRHSEITSSSSPVFTS
jgi:hypothetical protein